MPQNIHVESFLEMLAVERGAAATTCGSYRGNLNCFAEFLGERGCEINHAQINDLRAYLAALTEAGLARSTVAKHLSCLRQFYGFLFAEELRSGDPTSTIDSPRRGRPLPKVLSEAEVERLLDAAYARPGAAGIPTLTRPAFCEPTKHTQGLTGPRRLVPRARLCGGVLLFVNPDSSTTRKQ